MHAKVSNTRPPQGNRPNLLEALLITQRTPGNGKQPWAGARSAPGVSGAGITRQSSCWATSAAPVYWSSRTPGTLSPCSYRRLENTWLPLEERTPRAATKVLSVPAGMIRGADYTQAIVRPAVGDVLVLYTGGLTEAVNGLGEDLGLPALFEAARNAPIDSPVALGKAVLQ